MAHIGIQLEDERGKIIESSAINYAEIGLTVNKDEYPWLATIDPYGDTTFNILQIKNVLEELEKLSKQYKEKEAIIIEIISFINKINQDMHQYIKFIGD